MRSKSFSRSPFLEAARSMDLRTLASLVFHLPSFIRLFIRLMGDRRVPYYLKLLVYGAILYALFPIDIMPDLTFLGLGYVDDLVLLTLAVRKLVTGTPPEVLQEHVEAISGRPAQEYAEEEPEQEERQERRMKNVTPGVQSTSSEN